MIKRVLITGGAGFIGSHLADELLAHGYRVKAPDSLSPQVHGAERQRPPYLDQDVEVVPKDLRDPEALDQALRDVEAVFHFAAAVGVGQSMYEIEKYTSDNDLATGVLDVPVERIYWYSARDLDPEFPSKEGFHADDRDYHFGLFASDGTPKLLSRLWAGGGLEAVAPAPETHPGVRRNAAKPVPPWSLPVARDSSAPISPTVY